MPGVSATECGKKNAQTKKKKITFTDLLIYSHMYESIYIVQNTETPLCSFIQTGRNRVRVCIYAHPHTHALILIFTQANC